MQVQTYRRTRPGQKFGQMLGNIKNLQKSVITLQKSETVQKFVTIGGKNYGI
jgi:hypothetical protein